MTNELRTRYDEAAKTLITERANNCAFNVPLPTSVNELAGMLAGFALGVRNDYTDECLRGYVETKQAQTPKPKASKVTTFATTVLENAHVRIEYRDRGISGRDKTDKFNEPAFFTKNKRGLDRQWLHLVGAFNDDTTFRAAINVIREQGAKVHDYCAMD
jgi:hypothetical protein